MRNSLPIGSTLEQLLANTLPSGDCLIWQRGKTPNGYAKVSHKGKTIGAHRLVLFFDTGCWGEVALHKCDIKDCINPKHLAWGTASENSADMVAKNRSAKGSRVGTSKLNDEQVIEIRVKYAKGSSMRQLGREFGVSKTAIRFIVTREYWSHL